VVCCPDRRGSDNDQPADRRSTWRVEGDELTVTNAYKVDGEVTISNSQQRVADPHRGERMMKPMFVSLAL
jgi:hypothetical protein